MSKGLILGVFLAAAAVFLAACQVEEEVEGGDVTPTQGQTREGSEILVALDMDPSGNSCPGDGVHDCTLGAIDTCVEGTSLRETLCADAIDNDGDGRVNDGCPAVGAPEAHPTPNQCAGAVDDDGDTVVNDGCPAAFQFDVVVQNLPIRGAGEGQATFDFQLQWGGPLSEADAIDIVARTWASPAVHYLAQATGSSAALFDPLVLPVTTPPYTGSVVDLGAEETSPPWSQGTGWRGAAIIQNDASPDVYRLEFVPGSVGASNTIPVNECDAGGGMGPGCTLQGGSVAVAPMTCGEGRAQPPTATPARSQWVPPAPTVPPPLAELDRLRQEEASKPKFEGVLNGIRIYAPDAPPEDQPESPCIGAKPEEVEYPDMSAVAGTPLEIVPAYLPAGAEEQPPTFGPVVVCRGIVAWVERAWWIPGKGDFNIRRRQGEHAAAIAVPAERLSAATIGGKPAVLKKPLVEGYDSAAVYVAEDFGMTVVSGAALGLSMDEMVKIAEGLN
jgi:hypothetical protein